MLLLTIKIMKAHKPEFVNLVSSVDTAEKLASQEPSDIGLEFRYSSTPVRGADAYVFLGETAEINFSEPPKLTIFVATEPPDIRPYDLEVLRLYSAVIGPKFRYFSALDNFKAASGILPWSVGVRFPGKAEKISGLTYEKLAGSTLGPRLPGISTVTSTKASTRRQVERIQLVRFLSEHLPELQIFGRGNREIPDKAEALTGASYHLALENSWHPLYWTEKFSDPTLMGCFTFYSGHKSILREFDPKGFSLIDPSKPLSTLRIIERTMEKGINSQILDAIEANRRKILKERNLHSNIARCLDSLSIAGLRNTSLKAFPAHRRKKYLTKSGDPKRPSLVTIARRASQRKTDR